MLARKMGRPVRLTPPFRLHTLGTVRLELGDLWIAAPQGFKEPHLLDARGVKLTMRYGDLLALRRTPSAPVHIAAIDVDQLDARLIRRPDGSSTWQMGNEKGEPTPRPQIDRMDVRQGNVVLRDPTLATDLHATFSTQEGAADTAPTSHMKVEGTVRQRPLKGNLATGGLLPLGAEQGAAQPVPAKGWLEYGGVRLDFDGAVTDLAGERNMKGAVLVRGPSLAVLGRLMNSPLPTTGPFRIKGQMEKQGELWHATLDEARVGKSSLGGRFTYDPRPARPLLQGQLTGKRLILADLAPAFGTRDPDGREIKPPPGKVLPNRPLDLPSLSKMDAKLAVNFDTLDLGKAFSQPISPFKADLVLDKGKLTLSDISAKTARGTLAGTFSVDGTQPLPLWQANLELEDIRLEQWLKSAKAGAGNKLPAGSAASTPYFTGSLHGSAKLTGHGRSTAELLGSLDGRSVMFIRNGSVSHLVVEILGLDIAQGLGLLLGGDQPLPLQCAVADVEVQHGRVTPRVAMVDTPVTLVLVDGNVDLGRERLDLRLTAKPKNISPLTVRSPILVQGPFADPNAEPETGPIAARVMGAVALAFVNPLAAIIPFIDPGSSTSSPCGQSLANLKR